jgi:hypothetical protein
MKSSHYYCGMKQEEKSEQPIDLPPSTSPTSPVTSQADEYDRRGIKLPARARVGGIITPQ